MQQKQYFIESCESTSILSLAGEMKKIVKRYTNYADLVDTKLTSVPFGNHVCHYSIMTFVRMTDMEEEDYD